MPGGSGVAGLQWVNDLGDMTGVPTPAIKARLSGEVSVATQPGAKKAAPKPGGKDVKAGHPGLDMSGPLVLDLDKAGGHIEKQHVDPDDPDSPEIEVPVIPMPPPPIPKDLPSRDTTIQFLQKLPDHAGIMALRYGAALNSSCHAFEGYAKDKINDLAGGETDAPSLFASLAKVALDLVGGGAVMRIAEGVGRLVADAIKGAVNDRLGEEIKSKLKPKNDSAELLSAVQQLTQQTMDLNQALQSKIQGIMDEFVDPLISTLHDPKSKLKPDEEKKIYPYVRGDTTALRQLCASLGVPTDTNAKEINVQVFGGLVREFERTLQLKKAERWTKLQSGENKQKTIDEAIANAKKNALIATKERRREVEKAEAQQQ